MCAKPQECVCMVCLGLLSKYLFFVQKTKPTKHYNNPQIPLHPKLAVGYLAYVTTVLVKAIAMFC